MSEGFDDRPVVHFRSEGAFDCVLVGGERIRGNLRTGNQTGGEIAHESVGVVAVALSDGVAGNDLGFSVQSNPDQTSPKVGTHVVSLGGFLLRADEAPHLVNLDLRKV